MTEEFEHKGKVDPVDAYVGKRLKMRRIMLGLSQHDLGEAVNVSVQQIQKYEKATNRVSSGKLFAFSKLLMVPVEFFFNDIENDSEASAFADEVTAFQSAENIGEKEVLGLVKSFSGIKDGNIRKKVVELVKTLSDGNPNHAQ
jgi:transcriptional regulator with XRE-family HTH domain